MLGLWGGEHANVWLTTTLAATASALLLLMFCRGELAEDVALWGGPITLVMGGLAGVGCVLATHLLYPLIVDQLPAVAYETRKLYARLMVPPGPTGALPALAFVVLIEELVWRGVLMRGLQDTWPRSAIVVVSVVTYTLPQLGGHSWLLSVVALLFGLFLALLRTFSGSVVSTFVCHLVWNLGVFLLFPLENT